MPYTPVPKTAIPAAVIKQLRTGPASLARRDPFNPRDERAEEIRAKLFREYTLWLESWVVPELERLVPKAKS